MSSAVANVWVLDVAELRPAETERCKAVLAPSEREQMDRFHFAADREAYCAAHGLLRLALSRVEPKVPPQEWRFEPSAHGRPEHVAGSPYAQWRFNISHTRGMVACLVARDVDCGVDVESIPRFRDLQHIAKAVLSPAELRLLASVPEFERALLFCRYWTLKEAYAKALGLGLSLPFDKLEFVLSNDSNQAHLIRPFAPTLMASTPETSSKTPKSAHSTPDSDWQFQLWSPNPTHVLTTALRTAAATPLHLLTHLP